jgi:hypothetical protein
MIGKLQVGRLADGIDVSAAPQFPQPAPMTQKVERKRFNYSALPAAAAAIAQQAVEDIRRWQKAAVVDTGLALMKVKEALGHGAFGDWLDAEFGMGHRTATNYMNAAAFAEGKSAKISILPATALYALASPDADQQVVAEVLAEVEAGTVIPAQAVRDRLNDAIKVRAAAEAEARKTPDEIKKAKARDKYRRESEAEKKATAERELINLKSAQAESDRAAAEFLLEKLGAGDVAAFLIKMKGADWNTVRWLFLRQGGFTIGPILDPTAESVAENFRVNTAPKPSTDGGKA